MLSRQKLPPQYCPTTGMAERHDPSPGFVPLGRNALTAEVAVPSPGIAVRICLPSIEGCVDITLLIRPMECCLRAMQEKFSLSREN